ncbi:homeobox protein ATH1-like [Wolffia australiana]
MENEIFTVSVPLLNHGSAGMEAIAPAIELTSSGQQYYLMGGCPSFTNLQEDAINTLHRGAGVDGDDLLPGQPSSLFLSAPGSSISSLNSFDVHGDAPSFRWSLDELQARSMAGVSPSFRFSSISDPTWVSSKPAMIANEQYAYGVLGNELSLTLGSRRQSNVSMGGVHADQCSEMSCSGITQAAPRDNCYGDVPEFHASSQFHRLPSNGDLCVTAGGSSGHARVSQTVVGSPYFHAARQLLAEVAAPALCDQSRQNDEEGRSSPPKTEEFTAREPKTLKTDLINMLQLIDQGYSECVGRVQSVVTEFRTAGDSGVTQEPSDSVLHSVSALYRSLRERIIGRVLSLGQQIGGEFLFETEESLEYSFLQRQWALQQLKSDHQAWRPQRGLPEKSVAVLRSWMFRNFLHPYPKDSEKQLLAIKSGLTRSQVSNWFINARVRLWKPMIEDMCQEMNKKDSGEDRQGDRRNQRDAESPAIRAS